LYDSELNGQEKGFIELEFGPSWKYIACARSFIQNFLSISLANKEKADKIALASSELLENAVKYGSNDIIKLSIYVVHETENLVVEVINSATPEAIKILKNIYKKIIKGNPIDVYLSQMKEAALRSDGKSQLGLSRIRCEIGGELSLNIEDSQIKLAITIGRD